MKLYLMKSVPVMVLALGLAACGSNNEAKKAVDGAPAVQAPSINTTFESDCGADVAVASANAAFDMGSCQLNPAQLALLKEVGPFKVEADCVRQSVRIKNNADQISGTGSIGEDGTFAIPLTIGAQFSELEGCPVKLDGLASGKVTCDAEKRVSNVEVNTTFTFAHVATEESSVSANFGLVDTAFADGGQQGKQPAPAPQKGKEPAPAPKQPEAPKGKQPAPAPTPAPKQPAPKAPEAPKGKQPAPAPTPAPTKAPEQGKQQPVPAPKAPEAPKGKQPAPAPTPAPTKAPEQGKQQPLPQKGEQGKGGNGGQTPGQRVGACVSFAPCGFSTSASLSCAR